MDILLDKLNKEIISVFHHLDLYNKLGEIIDSNPNLSKMDSTLLVWMKNAFTVDLVISIGRICDRDTRTDSLVRFLETLKTNTYYLTRERYVELYDSSDTLNIGFANRDFDNLAGNGQQSYSPDLISEDISMLTEKEPIKNILTFRNQYLAHDDHAKDGPPPTYEILFQSFEIIEKIVKRYNLLLRASSIMDLRPVMQGNWEEVLTIPWIYKQQINNAECPPCQNT